MTRRCTRCISWAWNGWRAQFAARNSVRAFSRPASPPRRCRSGSRRATGRATSQRVTTGEWRAQLAAELRRRRTSASIARASRASAAYQAGEWLAQGARRSPSSTPAGHSPRMRRASASHCRHSVVAQRLATSVGIFPRPSSSSRSRAVRVVNLIAAALDGGEWSFRGRFAATAASSSCSYCTDYAVPISRSTPLRRSW